MSRRVRKDYPAEHQNAIRTPEHTRVTRDGCERSRPISLHKSATCGTHCTEMRLNQFIRGFSAPLPLAGEVAAHGSAIARRSAAGGGNSIHSTKSFRGGTPTIADASRRRSSIYLRTATPDTEFRSRDAIRPRFAEESLAPWNQRARGMPDARCIRGLVCKKQKEDAHEHTGQRRRSDIPCAMALRLTSCSPR